MKYARSSRADLMRKIVAARNIFLMLDFDGTLVSIARSPNAVVLKSQMRSVVSELGRSPSCRVAVISGRSLKNLIPYFNLKDLFYAGNHGLELKGRGIRIPARATKARKYGALIWLLGEKLKKDLLKVPGILIEDKNYTLSVHYRNVPREYQPFLLQELDFFKRKYSHWPVQWREGKKVLEVRPKVPWGKGDAARYLLSRSPRALPIVIGDDVTDEDMFRALRRRGVTIRVGRLARSAAEYYLRSTSDVRSFLAELVRQRNRHDID
ncbi:MAG TPA: trehalose-phosphatase [Candidatus Omnitrophota bacterium]|nr:trehalose-phosphatase [Candidatus Omnitrophota bacterium]